MGPDDNVGIDSGEGVEISGPAGTGLDGYVIVLYNGANRMIYSYSALDGVIPDQLGGFGAVFFSFNFSVQMTSTSFDPFHHARFNQRPQPRAPGARSTAWQSARASGGAVVLRLFLWHHNGGCVAIGVTAPPPKPTSCPTAPNASKMYQHVTCRSIFIRCWGFRAQIQNGPDAIALVHRANDDEVLEFVSCE